MSIGNVFPVGMGLQLQSVSPKGHAQYSLVGAVTLAQAAGGSIPAGATTVVIVSEDFHFRYRDDGTAASQTVGMPIAGGGMLVYTGNLANLTLAPFSAATLNLAFYG